MIKPETVQKILDAARIEEVVGDFVSLKKRGTNLLGLCPFHNEKTPSFVVSPAKGIFKCFGCGKAGSAVHFIMEHEHSSYPEALKYLAKKYNIEIEEAAKTPEDILRENLMDRLYNLNSFAQKHFSDLLFNDSRGRSVGLSYFKERGFLEDTIKSFQLGYAVDDYEELINYAIKNGYKKDIIEASGLVTVRDDGKIYDRFRGRVIFPIHNLTGRVIGFGGRIMTADKTKAKYINSPETEIYHKSNTLYGIYFAKSAIVAQDVCYLVEGYTDVISMHQAGFKNVVASSGTSLTVEQIALIKRFTQNVTIIYDGDFAGIKASLRGIDMVLEAGLNVRIVPLPPEDDPDSFVRNHSSSEVMAYLKDKACDFIRFKTELLLKDAADDPIKRAEVIKDVVGSIALIADPIYRSVFLKECASLLDIKEQTLIFETNKIISKKNYQKKDNVPLIAEQKPEEKTDVNKVVREKYQPDNHSFLERSVIEKLLLYGQIECDYDTSIEDEQPQESEPELVSTAEYILSETVYDGIEFENFAYKKIIDIYLKAKEAGSIPDIKYFINNEDADLSKTVAEIIATPYTLSDNWSEYKVYVKKESDDVANTVIRSLLALKVSYLKRIRDKIQEKMKTASDEQAIELIKKDIGLKEHEMYINKILNRIIT
ncbi:MAG: DNA primase [Bacteroidales bacterium]|jgi:DNA primase|nr:DNA primase [Bacteroidales bacterium]MDD3914850.1 DNA primase [Bacteroidales bacterium]MDD4633833.1 DNA primase [Bacteroidales bacterium]